MKDMQHSGTGSTGQDLHKAQLLLLFWGGNVPPSLWAGFMDAVGLCSTCWAHLLHIQCAGDTDPYPWVTAGSCLGRNTEGVSSATGQCPGVASNSFSTWVPHCMASGCTGELVLPSEQFSHQQHKLPASRWLQSRDTPVCQQVMPPHRLPGKGPAPDWPSTSPEQAL